MNREERRLKKKQEGRENRKRSPIIKGRWVGPFFAVSSDGKLNSEKIRTLGNNLCNEIVIRYLERMGVYEAPFELDIVYEDPRDMYTISRSVHNILQSLYMEPSADGNVPRIRFKVHNADTTIYFMIIYWSKKDVDITVNTVSSSDQVSQFLFYRDNESWDIVRETTISMYTSPIKSIAERTAVEMSGKNSNKYRLSDMVLLEKCLSLVTNNADTECPDVEVSDIEFEIMKLMIRHMKATRMFPLVYQLAGDPNIAEYDQFFKGVPDVPLDVEINEYNYHLVDFTPREKKYVEKYVLEAGHFVEGENGPKPIDLVQYMTHTRYGERMRVINKEDGTNTYFTYRLDTINNMARFWFIKVADTRGAVVTTIDCKNIRDFTTRDIIRFQTTLVVTDPDKLPRSTAEMVSIVPSTMTGTESIVRLIASVISLMIVIHDRPERTAMVKVTRRLGDPNVIQKGPEQEQDYVVRHILMPIRKAREYIRLTSNDPSNREVQYTKAEWYRVGYWRRVRGSDRQVYIPPTTCHRHLEMSKKKVHLKL